MYVASGTPLTPTGCSAPAVQGRRYRFVCVLTAAETFIIDYTGVTEVETQFWPPGCSSTTLSYFK